MRRARGRILCPLALAIFFSSPARAQDSQGPAFNLELFRPAIDSKGYFTVDASRTLGHLDFSIGLTGSYARDVLVLRNPDVLGVSGAGGTARGEAAFRVSDLVTAQVQGAIGLFKWGELGVSLPVHLLFGSRGPGYVSPSSGNLNSDLTFGAQMVGDLGIHAKVRALGAARYPVGLAFIASVYAPTGQADKFLGEGRASLRPEIILDREFGRARRVRLALNVGALVRFDRNTFTDRGTTLNAPGSNVDRTVNGGAPFCFPAPSLSMAPLTCGTGRSRSLGTQVTYALGVSGAVVPEKLDLLAELSGYADVTGGDPDGRHGFPLEWRAGAKVYLASKSYFEFGAGTGIIPGQTGSPSVRAFLGFIFEPPVGERYEEAARSDPDPPPKAAPAPEPDRDGDGIPDRLDKCPDEPEDFDGFEDEDGCPDPDNDKDGILDVDDLCPNEPEDFDGFEDKDGCPDPDNDKDHIPDKDDQCPNDPETYNGYRDDDGCPDKGPVRVRRGALQIGKVYFETAKATIKPISFPILDAVAATLKGYPQLALVEIQGHADERGDDDYNLRLTEDRAQAVKQYLIDHGVEADRLRAHGYGETRPVCSRHNLGCWSKNRRVEFIILHQDGAIPGQGDP